MASFSAAVSPSNRRAMAVSIRGPCTTAVANPDGRRTMSVDSGRAPARSRRILGGDVVGVSRLKRRAARLGAQATRCRLTSAARTGRPRRQRRPPLARCRQAARAAALSNRERDTAPLACRGQQRLRRDAGRILPVARADAVPVMSSMVTPDAVNRAPRDARRASANPSTSEPRDIRQIAGVKPSQNPWGHDFTKSDD